MNYRGRRVTAKVFVEELYAAGTVPESPTYSTGKLIEVGGFKSLDWTNSVDLDKSFRIVLSNPGNVMTTSVLQERGISKPSPSNRTVAHNRTYIDRLYSERPLNNLYDISDNAVARAKAAATNKEFLHGYRNDGKNDVGMYNDFVLGEMQRIWVILKIEEDNGEVRYHRIGGIITGFGESVDYSSGNASFNIECAGFSRLLELTRTHIKQFEFAPYRTQTELFSKRVLEQIMPLDAMAQDEGVLGSLGPVGALLYATWVSNAIFSWHGRLAMYPQAKVFQHIYSGDTVNTMFYQAPIWLLGPQVPQVPESSRGFLQDLREDSPMPQSFQTWARDTKAMMFGADNYRYLNARSSMFTQRRVDEAACQRLFEEGPGTWSNVASLLPRVYYDDMIQHLFGDDAGLQVFAKKYIASVQAFSFSTMSAADILNKVASAMLGNMREDDAGNLILEIPRYWEAPALDRDDAAQVTIIQYSDKKTLPDACVTVDYDAPDYIMDGDTMLSYNSAVSEANIVTHVETPAKWQYQESTDEVIEKQDMTGYSGNRPDDPDRGEEIAALERRYGFRSMTAPTLYSLNLELKNPNGESVRLKAALDSYADAILDSRNYARSAGTVRPIFMPWLDCGRNIMLMERGELWLIKTKSCSYRIGETEADATITLSCASAHAVTERLGYPYLDAITAVESSQYVQHIKAQIAAEAASTGTVYNGTASAIPDSDAFDDVIYDASAEFSLPPDMLKGLIAHESRFNPNAVSGSGAKGLAQLTSIAILDVKQNFLQLAGADPLDPKDNLRMGAAYLNLCLRDNENNTLFAVLGYNRGRGLPKREAKKYAEAQGIPLNTVMRSIRHTTRVLKSIPKDQYGNPPGDAYVKYVSRQFDLYAAPNRGLWEAVTVPSLWTPRRGYTDVG